MSDPVGSTAIAPASMVNGNTAESSDNSDSNKSSPSKNDAKNAENLSANNNATSKEASTNGENGTSGDHRSLDYQKLIDHGLDDKVATRLEEIYKTGTYFNYIIFLILTT